MSTPFSEKIKIFLQIFCRLAYFINYGIIKFRVNKGRNNMKTKNEKFNEMLNRFYENGLMKEVYASEHAIVCNILDQLYVVFNVFVMDEWKNEYGYPGFIVNSRGLRNILKDDVYVHAHYLSLPEKMQRDYLLVLNEKFYRHMVDNKERLSQKPPNPEIDLEFEKAVIEHGKGALDLFPDEKEKSDEKSKKRRFFGLFK
jgi:hypothetical protein